MLHPVNADIFYWMLGLTTCTRIPPFPLPILPGYISRKISYVSPCGLDHIAGFLHMSLGYRHIGPGIHTYPSKMLFWIKILEDWYETPPKPPPVLSFWKLSNRPWCWSFGPLFVRRNSARAESAYSSSAEPFYAWCQHPLGWGVCGGFRHSRKFIIIFLNLAL